MSGGAAPLEVYGAAGVIEVAPVRLAMEDLYGPGAKVAPGGIASLVAPGSTADLATNAETQILLQSLTRPDLRIIMTVVEGDYHIIARRSAGITSIADLRNKRVATALYTSSGYFLSLMLAKAGMTLADVQIRDIRPYSAMVAALSAGEVDAISIWEPHGQNALTSLGPDGLDIPGNGVYRELFNLNTTAGKLADPVTRARIVAFVRELVAATRRLNRNPRRAQQLAATAGGYTVDEVRGSWKHHRFTASLPSDMLDVMVKEELWLAALQKREPRSRDALSQLIDRSIFDEATESVR